MRKKFLEWYDYASRLDFAGTLFGLFFDWRAALVALFWGIATFFWAAIEGHSPLVVWLSANLAGACCAVIIAVGLTLANRFPWK